MAKDTAKDTIEPPISFEAEQRKRRLIIEQKEKNEVDDSAPYNGSPAIGLLGGALLKRQKAKVVPQDK